MILIACTLALNYHIAKKYCIEAYTKCKLNDETVPSHSEKQLAQLLNLCLDYSYVTYKNEYFIQRNGIQMGNPASVTIANITAYYEIKDMLGKLPEIVFNARFVDDGFLYWIVHLSKMSKNG